MVYRGEWENDVMHGIGTFIDKDNNKINVRM